MKLDHSIYLDHRSPEYLELLTSPEKRKSLAKIVLRIFDLWKLDSVTQLMLLGLGTKSRALLTKYRNGVSPIASNQDALQRVGYIIAIYQLLKSLYPKNKTLRNNWVKRKNAKLKNLTPLEIMLNGIPELKQINALLQYQMVR